MVLRGQGQAAVSEQGLAKVQAPELVPLAVGWRQEVTVAEDRLARCWRWPSCQKLAPHHRKLSILSVTLSRQETTQAGFADWVRLDPLRSVRI